MASGRDDVIDRHRCPERTAWPHLDLRSENPSNGGKFQVFDREKGKNRGKNTVYVMYVDEVSVCHLGDLGHALSVEQAEAVDEVDVLLLPVGGVSTINATMAAEVVRQLGPKVVVPMHYKTPALNREL